MAIMQSALQPMANLPSMDVCQQAGGPFLQAMPNPAPLVYAPQILPAPVTLADGTTHYAGETTAFITDPMVLAPSPTADGTPSESLSPTADGTLE